MKFRKFKKLLGKCKNKNFLSTNCPTQFGILGDLKEIFGYHPDNTCVERFQKIIIYKFLENQILEQTGTQYPKLKALNEQKKRIIQEEIDKYKVKLMDNTINLDQNLPGSSSR